MCIIPRGCTVHTCYCKTPPHHLVHTSLCFTYLNLQLPERQGMGDCCLDRKTINKVTARRGQRYCYRKQKSQRWLDAGLALSPSHSNMPSDTEALKSHCDCTCIQRGAGDSPWLSSDDDLIRVMKGLVNKSTSTAMKLESQRSCNL